MGAGSAISLPGADYSAITAAADAHFTEHGDVQVKTSSLAVAYRGKLVYERYAEGFGPDTPIYGFSLGKTLAALMAGVMVEQGKLDIHAPTGLSEWQQDDRARITPHHLLTMTSGLSWSETYDKPTSDANLLFIKDDMATFAASKPLQNTPGSTYNYSSGSTLILAM